MACLWVLCQGFRDVKGTGVYRVKKSRVERCEESTDRDVLFERHFPFAVWVRQGEFVCPS
jgi:hypothetical protein